MEEFTLEDWLWFKKKLESEISLVSSLFGRLNNEIYAGTIENTEEVGLHRDGLFFEIVALKTRLGIVADIIKSHPNFVEA